ncbi:hypothetical protein BGX23_005881 [Mortierella sp. AD031]|nr:hypothetical protein BGX23_005881 [Mortierella sp. AD031]
MMTIPRGRGNLEWWGTCASGFGCHGPCDSKRAQDPILTDPSYQPQTIRRGDILTITWQRFNHPDGFVRLAIIPFEQSDDWTAFNAANAAKFSCYESNCGPDDPNDDYLGNMNGPGDGLCSTTFIVPQDFPDGKATLQWMWYGGGVYYGQPEAGFGEYCTCTDYLVQGGNDLVPRGSLGDQRVWQGGDASNPGTDVCKADDLLNQSLEPCSRTGEFVGRAAGFEAGGGSRHLKKRVGRGVRSDAYVNAHAVNVAA